MSSSLLCRNVLRQNALAPSSRSSVLLASTSDFHSTSHPNNRSVPLQTRISRRSWARNQRKIDDLRTRLGDKYAEIGRDKRRSPTTTTRSSTSLSQSPPVPAPPSKILPFLAAKTRTRPHPIVVGDLKATLATVKGDVSALAQVNERSVAFANASPRNIRDLKKRDVNGAETSRDLTLPENSIPEPARPVTFGARKLPESIPAFPAPATSGPAYAFSLSAEEAKLVLGDAPASAQSPEDRSTSAAQAEMVRRILSLENGNQKQINKYNTDRCVQMFGRAPTDTGSPEVQAAVFTVRIKAIEDHLSTHKKDMSTKRQLEKWVSKRMKILKYLRRTNLQKFVETCQALGVDPDVIRV
ncbi:hypothetical protein HKX48_005494 [Thoreauomyces humboldtii]|nr:hypothetical protein HKX48_005494 [Thoreauomyces humboldtii]